MKKNTKQITCSYDQRKPKDTKGNKSKLLQKTNTKSLKKK